MISLCYNCLHEKEDQEWIPQLAGLLAVLRKEEDDGRLRYPQCRGDLADFNRSIACFCE